MKRTTTPFLTRCLSGALAVLIPIQVTLSCAPPGRVQESLSRVQGNKTDLMFDMQKSDSSTDTSPGEGWGDRSDGNKTTTDWLATRFPEFVNGFREVPAEFPGLGYDTVLVPIGDTDLKLTTSPPERKGEPPQIEISLKAPSNTDKNDDDAKRPSFPLNPANLKTKPEVQSDVQKRLVEREKTAKDRQGTLGKQVAQSEAKQKQAPPGALGKAVGSAEGEHGQAAGDIKTSLEKTVADATSGTDAPPPADATAGTDTGPGLPANGIPGTRGEKLARTRERANEAAAAEKNPFSKDLAQAAKGLLDDAEKKAREGNPNKADEKEKEARRLVDLAGIPPERMPPRRPKGEKPAGPEAPINERRGEAMGLGLDLYEAADDLSKGGFSGLSEKTRRAAAIAIDVGIGVARFGALFDLPLSVMEAFGGLTLEANKDGTIGFREATKLEMAFGFAAVAAAGLAFGAGGWTAVVGGAVIGGITKGAAKGLQRRLGKGPAKKAAEEAAKDAPKVVEKLGSEGLTALEEVLRKLFPGPQNERRVQRIIDAFEAGTIERMVIPPEGLTVQRWHDDRSPRLGGWVSTEKFPDAGIAREKLAVLDHWSDMKYNIELRLKPDTVVFTGIVSPQGPYKGGATQIYVPTPESSFY